MTFKYRYVLKYSMTAFVSILIFSSLAAQDPLISKVYEWNDIPARGKHGIQVRNILKGETRSLKVFEIKAVTLIGGYSIREYKIKKGFDELFVVKEGTAVITVNGRSERLGEGSVTVASHGDVIKVLNGAKNDLTFYSFKFRPHESESAATAVKAEPFIKEWNDIEFKVNANGGRRDIIRQPFSPLKELEMHTTQLKEGLPSHSSHTHVDEEIILVRFGRVEETINGKPFQCGPGSVLFLTNDDDHGIRNVGEGPCEYYAIRWLTW
jgi:mannose-6-phosphate isomerase-like protein (cupin superfamily)